MTPEREHRAGTLFLTAIELDAPERHALLEDIGAQDPALRTDVESLLLADERNSDGFLRSPIAEAALIELENRPPEQRPDHTPLTSIGAYRVIQELGRGQHAIVYLTQQTEPVERRVAIKVLSSPDGSSGIVRRFETERRILAMMDHPNIAKLFEAGVTEQRQAYFVMEYVEGGPISVFCRDNSLSLRERLELFCQICRAVEHAHQRGIIHRDLKPTNILVSSPSDGPPMVKVIDFGVARAVGAGLRSFPSHTLQGQLVGTIGYMSPEQITGGDGALVDTRSDVYALGAVLYELLCDTPAIVTVDAGPATVIARITKEGPRPPSSLRPALKGDVEIIISCAMRREPADRYPSVAALREDIERYLFSRPITARPPNPAYLARRFAYRHRMMVVVLLVLGVLLGAAAARMWMAERSKFDIAVEMTQSWFDHSQHMAKTAGEREKRRPLLDRLRTQSQSLLSRAPTHSGVLGLRADVLGAAGDLALEDGKAEEARGHFESAMAIRRGLAKRLSGSLDHRMDLSISIVRVGDAFKDLGNLPRAQELYEQAMELDAGSVDASPDSARAVTLLAWSYDRLASMAAVQHEQVLADALHDAALEWMERLNTLEISADARRGLCVAHSHVGDTARRKGDIASYREHTVQSLEQAVAAVELKPDDRLAQWALLGARLRFVNAFGESLGPEVSEDYALETLKRAQTLVILDPIDEPIHGCLIGALEAAADCAERAGDVDLAASLRNSQVEESLSYLESRPGDSKAKDDHSRAVNVRGQFLARHDGRFATPSSPPP